MRTTRVLAMVIVALLLAGGSVLAQGGFKTYLPQVQYLPTPIPTATPPPPTATPPPSGEGYDGSWAGTTSQSRPIGFTVAGNGITQTVFGYDFRSSCGVSGTITVTFGIPSPISDDAFSVSFDDAGPSSLSYDLSGSFSSPSTASGDLSLTYSRSFPYTSCSATADLTWTATRGATSAALAPSMAVPEPPSLTPIAVRRESAQQ
ncbi:MAG: hypothetical protein HGA45_39075 [Chloroflexales bacterium]|nr:hypothetical protein [Chloroflexales bacterium]